MSGANETGKVTKAVQAVVVLFELSGRDFFDAVIHYDKSSVVIIKGEGPLSPHLA